MFLILKFLNKEREGVTSEEFGIEEWTFATYTKFKYQGH